MGTTKTKEKDNLINKLDTRKKMHDADTVELNIFKQICDIIAKWDVYKAAAIVNEILMIHDMIAWDINTKAMTEIESVSINGSYIQLNLEKYAEEQ